MLFKIWRVCKVTLTIRVKIDELSKQIGSTERKMPDLETAREAIEKKQMLMRKIKEKMNNRLK
jgi:predicted ABC-type ATPase